MSSAFIEVLLPVLVIVSCGFALRRVFPLDLQSLNRVSLYILSPALIFVTLARIQVAGDEALRIAGVTVALCALLAGVTLLCAWPLRLDRQRLAALLLCTMFANAGNFGLPTARFAFGDAGFQRALLFFIPYQILSQILAILIAGAGRGDGRSTLRQVFRMPQIYAVIAGALVAVSGMRLDGRHDALGSLFRGAALLSDATLPFLLLLLGMQLSLGVTIEDRRLTSLAAGIRLLASPALAYGLALLFGLDDLALRVVVLEASMPTAVNMVLYSIEFDTRPRFVAGVVVITTVLALVTLTLLLALLRI